MMNYKCTTTTLVFSLATLNLKLDGTENIKPTAANKLNHLWRTSLAAQRYRDINLKAALVLFSNRQSVQYFVRIMQYHMRGSADILIISTGVMWS